MACSCHLGVVGAGGQVVEGVLQLLALQEAQRVRVGLGAGGQGAAEGGDVVYCTVRRGLKMIVGIQTEHSS